jgi:fibronectin-binding autotransporter adhesin
VPNGTLATNNSVKFTGLSSTATLDLFAQQFSFASGSTVEADVGLFNLEPQTATTLTNVAILDNFQNSTANSSYGEVNLTSPSTLSLVGSTVQGSFVVLDGVTGISITNGSTVNATFGDLSILDGGGITISGSTIKATQGLLFGDSNSGLVDIAAVGGAVNITGGTVISAPAQINITSDTGVSIAGASTITSGGFLDILSDTTPSASISVTGNSTLTSGPTSNLILQASASLTVNGATLNTDPTYGQVFMDAIATSGLITVKNTSISTNNLTLNSGDGILLDGTGGALTLTGTGTSPQVNLTAAGGSGGVLAITGKGSGAHPNIDFSSFSTVNIAAHTINLANVAFGGGSAVNLQSNIPTLALNPNTNAVSVPGEVNFITGVTYGGNPAQGSVAIAQGGTYAPSTSPAPIQITKGPY